MVFINELHGHLSYVPKGPVLEGYRTNFCCIYEWKSLMLIGIDTYNLTTNATNIYRRISTTIFTSWLWCQRYPSRINNLY
jgi:hypothetical protein